MHQNNVFFLNLFLTSAHQNDPKTLIFFFKILTKSRFNLNSKQALHHNTRHSYFPHKIGGIDVKPTISYLEFSNIAS
jgi:hypothetical protein